MKRLFSISVVVLGLALAGPLGYSQSSPTAKPVMKHVTGAFDVKVIPQPAEDAGGAGIGRMLLDKQFHGDLEATSKGQMLASGTGAAGSSGAYVALEVVTGTLGGRKGTFVLQHSATMDRGVPALSVTVVPGSGTGELVGLTGKMEIVIADGKHSYVFDYTLPE
jgi:Protein of unknown function (DUF3224)